MAVSSRTWSRVPWPAVAASAILVLVTLALLSRALGATGGRLVYTLDDPYIHMAIARNLALHGEWSVTPGRFEPASSSPLWTLMLAAVYRLFGVGEAALLAMNLVLIVGVALALDRLLRPAIPGGPARAAAVLGIGLAIPLPAVALTGMETTLHVLLALLLGWRVAVRLADPAPGPAGGGVAVAALSFLAVLTRFESGFLIGALAAGALAGRRPRVAGALALGAALALAGYMSFALPRGGLWLPNSVLVKSGLADLATLEGWGRLVSRIPYELLWRRNSHLTALLVAAAALLAIGGRADGRAAAPRRLLAAFLPAALLHVQFAGLGWFFRYEAYLMALGLSAVAATLALEARQGAPAWRRAPAAARAALAALALVLVIPLATRTARSMRQAPLAIRNVYEQQYQMGRFVRAYFRDREVAVNDLGAVGYFGGGRIEDLFGLATTPVARARLERRYDTAFIERWCAARGVEVALVHDGWFREATRLPATWRTLARWTIRDNVVAGDATVTVLATGPASIGRVRAAVRAFAPTLPRGVAVELLD